MTQESIKNSDEAETLALEVLKFVLADEVLQGRFMLITGITPTDFRQAVHEKEFLGGVLDSFLAMKRIFLNSVKNMKLIRSNRQ